MEFELGYKENWNYWLSQLFTKLALDESYLQKVKVTKRIDQKAKVSTT